MRISRLRLLTILLTAFGAASGAWAADGGRLTAATQAPTSGTAFLAGQIVEHPSGRGIARATVLLSSNGRGSAAPARGGQPNALPSLVTADSQGRFFFSALPAGAYTIQVPDPGLGVTAVSNLSRVFDLADGQRISDVRIRFAKFGVIAGTIRDEVGDPVVGTDVWALRRAIVNGRHTLTRSTSSRSDDHGAYRLMNLTAGDYVVCACGRDPIPFDGVLLSTLAADPLQLLSVAMRALKVGGDAVSMDATVRTYMPTFYPSSPTMARASTVVVGPGEDKPNVDIDVASIRATRVSGAVVGAIGPVQASAIRLVPAGENAETAALAALTPVLVQPDGRFDFTGVPPGQYTLRAVHTPTNGRGGGAPTGAALQFLGSRGIGMAPGAPQLADEPPLFATEPVSVGESGITGLSVLLRRAPGVSGRVQFVGSATPPPAAMLTRLAIIPQPAMQDMTGLGFGNVGRVTAEGTFRMPGVLPGRYTLTSTTLPGWLTLKSIAVGGVDVTDLPIDIDGTDINDVVVTFTDTLAATLSGTLTGENRASADRTILVFPTDQRYWNDPAISRRRYRSVSASHAGDFTIAGLPAGEYFVVGVPDEETIEWQEANRLAALSKTAQRVSLVDGDKKTVEVRR